jgi:hypothetical protein
MSVEFTTESIELVLTVAGFAAAIFTGQKFITAKNAFLEVIGDVANLMALVHGVAKAGTCSPEQLTVIAKKTEEVWTDIQALGPSFAALLESKTGLAKLIGK